MTKISNNTPASQDASNGSSEQAGKPSRAKIPKALKSTNKVPPNGDGENLADTPLYYVGIGASAGGLEALRPFVLGLPAHANMTYIVAQHMSPDHRSLMVELLARETSLKVEEARNNIPPKADTIYVAPPNSDVTVSKGKLHISKPTNTIGPKPSDSLLILAFEVHNAPSH
jgi:chemotaxis response regulator CheB